MDCLQLKQTCKYNYKFWLREEASACQGLAVMLFGYKDAASEYRTEVSRWDGGSELGKQELGKGAQHYSRADDFRKFSKGKVHNAITLGAVLHSPCQGTLPEPMDRVIWSALHLTVKPNTQH